MASKTELAWAAGIIDGEGSIAMTKAIVGVNRRSTPSFQIRISVRMTHRATVSKLHQLFGGTFKTCKPKIPSRHKRSFEWYVGDILTQKTLLQIQPFLITKSNQANLVLKYRRRCANGGATGRSPCSASVVKLRRSFFNKLKTLNRKGPPNGK